MKRAIILADEPSPVPVNGSGHVRSLAKVSGLPLIVRNLRTLQAAGVEEAVIVTGYESQKVRDALSRYHLGMPVVEVYNQKWNQGTALSILAAAKWIDEPCLIVPCDHLYPPSLVRRMFGSPAPVESLLLAVDQRTDEVFDENVCTKVDADFEHHSAIAIGATLPEHNCICPGMMRVSGEAIEALRSFVGRVEAADLSEWLGVMAIDGRVRTLDVASARWISITSPQARRYAELLLQLHGDTLETSERGADATLLNPGPVETTPRVKAAVGSRDMCHREPVFSSLLDSVQRKLRLVFGADDDHDVLLVTASGTGGLESAISTFVPAQKKFLVIRNGAFGERLVEIANTYGVDVIELAVPWGADIPVDAVATLLDEHPEIGIVGMIHHETSIGVINPVAEVGELTRGRGVPLLVDTVSSLGGEDVDVVRDKIDICITSANKCLHAFSGLASVCVRRNVWETVAGDAPRNYYFDLRKYYSYMRSRRQTPFTPAVNTMMSLDAALDELLEVGLEERWEHYRRLNDRIRNGVRTLGFELLVDEERSSHSLTLVRVPQDLTYQGIYQGLKDRGFIVYECKDELAGKYFQVANMGALEEDHIDGFLAALCDYLAEARRTDRIYSVDLLA